MNNDTKKIYDEIFTSIPDYKERFKLEYFELSTRYDRLFNIVAKTRNGKLNFRLDCPLTTLENQLKAMKNYLIILEERAIYENIKLKENEDD